MSQRMPDEPDISSSAFSYLHGQASFEHDKARTKYREGDRTNPLTGSVDDKRETTLGREGY